MYPGSGITDAHLKVLLSVFATLEQRVLMRWDNPNLKDLPKNVFVSKWVPQQDVLGHRNTRLLLGHGGLNSLAEALFHEVPVIMMPLYGEQFSDAPKVKRMGYGMVLHWSELDEEKLR